MPLRTDVQRGVVERVPEEELHVVALCGGGARRISGGAGTSDGGFAPRLPRSTQHAWAARSSACVATHAVDGRPRRGDGHIIKLARRG